MKNYNYARYFLVLKLIDLMSYLLRPEVAGQLGKQTELDSTLFPPTVHQLHYQFDDWLGDDILESFPCFLVSERLQTRLQAFPFNRISACNFDNNEIRTQ